MIQGVSTKGIILLICIIIGSTALGGTWPPQTNFATNLCSGHPPANFYNPFTLRLPIPRQSILISVGHVLVDLQGLSIMSFAVIRFYPLAQHGPPTTVYWISLYEGESNENLKYCFYFFVMDHVVC